MSVNNWLHAEGNRGKSNSNLCLSVWSVYPYVAVKITYRIIFITRFPRHCNQQYLIERAINTSNLFSYVILAKIFIYSYKLTTILITTIFLTNKQGRYSPVCPTLIFPSTKQFLSLVYSVQLMIVSNFYVSYPITTKFLKNRPWLLLCLPVFQNIVDLCVKMLIMIF